MVCDLRRAFNFYYCRLYPGPIGLSIYLRRAFNFYYCSIEEKKGRVRSWQSCLLTLPFYDCFSNGIDVDSHQKYTTSVSRCIAFPNFLTLFLSTSKISTESLPPNLGDQSVLIYEILMDVYAICVMAECKNGAKGYFQSARLAILYAAALSFELILANNFFALSSKGNNSDNIRASTKSVNTI